MQSASFSAPLVHGDGEIVAGLLEDAHATRSDGEDRPHRIHTRPGLWVAVDMVDQLQGLRCYEDAMRPMWCSACRCSRRWTVGPLPARRLPALQSKLADH